MNAVVVCGDVEDTSPYVIWSGEVEVPTYARSKIKVLRTFRLVMIPYNDDELCLEERFMDKLNNESWQQLDEEDCHEQIMAVCMKCALMKYILNSRRG